MILFTPILRKLVNESNGVFLSIQKIVAKATGEVRPELLKYSKQYRSILRACVETLQDASEKIPDDRETLVNFMTIFYNVECVWHLTEILYIDTVPGDVILPQLLEWVRFHFPSRALSAAKILAKQTIGSELDNQNYWETVIGCALHGKLDIVRGLLALHSKADHPAFITADVRLRTMPVYNIYGGYSTSEFINRYQLLLKKISPFYHHKN